MASNQQGPTYPYTEIAENFDEKRIENQMNLQQMEQMFGELIHKNIEYRNRCKSEQIKNDTLKSAFAKMYYELSRQCDENAKLKKELNIVHTKLKISENKYQRLQRKLKAIVLDTDGDDEMVE